MKLLQNLFHYENLLMRYLEIFSAAVKIENFVGKNFEIFNILAQNLARLF